jgi:hypothetical protein
MKNTRKKWLNLLIIVFLITTVLFIFGRYFNSRKLREYNNYKRVCVMQTDNRPNLDYLLKTQEVNKYYCDFQNNYL